MAKASIVIPVYNGEKFIEGTLLSLQNQTERDIEIVVVNDHSDDGTLEIVERLANSDTRIKLLDNTNERGEAITRNCGILNSTGNFVLPNDADDPSYPNRVEKSIYYLEKNQADFFYGNIVHFYSDTLAEKNRFYQEYDSELLRYLCYIPHPGIAYTRKAYDQIGGYDPSIKIGTDYDMWLTAQDQHLKFYSKNIPLAKYTIHPGQMTVKNPEIISNRQFWLKKIRTKHNITSIDFEYILNNADSSVIEFFVRDDFYKEVWLGQGSLPDNQL